MEQKIQLTDEQVKYLMNFANTCYSYYYTVGQNEDQNKLYLYVAKAAQYIFQRSRRNQLLNIINLKMKKGVDPGYDFEYYGGQKVKVVPYVDFNNRYATYAGPMQAASQIAVVAYDITKKRGAVLFETTVQELIANGAMQATDENTRRIDVQKVVSLLNSK